ncbi:flavodoxin family protein [Dankookia sp. P2]|uniref:flavodoxin family protein n=1 Tax=Dankookia sp. P2 TaxID=3423955 RepID=UPI003D674DDC
MPRLLIVFHSRTGAARQMAEAAARGAGAEAEVRLLPAEAAGPEDLLDAQGYLFAAPENLASLSGPMKDFFDRCYYPVLDRLNGRPYALLIAAGSDGTGAARQAARIATGWRLRAVAEPLILCTQGADRRGDPGGEGAGRGGAAPLRGTGRGAGSRAGARHLLSARRSGFRCPPPYRVR